MTNNSMSTSSSTDASRFSVERVRSASVLGPNVCMHYVWVRVGRSMRDGASLRPFEVALAGTRSDRCARTCRLLIAVPNEVEHDEMVLMDADHAEDSHFSGGYQKVATALARIAITKYALGSEYSGNVDADSDFGQYGIFFHAESIVHDGSSAASRCEQVLHLSASEVEPRDAADYLAEVQALNQSGNHVADSDLVDALIIPNNYSTTPINHGRTVVYSSMLNGWNAYPSTITPNVRCVHHTEDNSGAEARSGGNDALDRDAPLIC